MTMWLKQSTAQTVVLGPFVDDTDFKTEETALTIAQADIRLSKNGGAFAQTNNAAGATHMENGYYSVPLDTTDTNTLGRLDVNVDEAGALKVWVSFMIASANVWDSMFGADKIQVDLTEIVGVAQSATDLKDFADDGYDPATNKVQGVVLADTITTYTGDTPQTGDSFARIGATGSGLTSIADQVWDEDATAHQTLGTFGQAIGDPVANAETLYKAIVTDPAGTNIASDVIAIKAETASILSDTNAILVDTGTTLDGRIPALLVGGRMDSSVGAMAANVITAAAINAAALTAAKFAAGAIDAAAIATGAIDADALAAGTITAAKFAAGAIDATALDTTAVAEIVAAIFADSITELAAVPGASPSMRDALALLYMATRNKRVTDSGVGNDKIHNNAGAAVGTATLSDAAGVFTKNQYT